MNEELLKNRHKNAFQLWFYAIQRIDLLIISISGAGLYLVFETLKLSSETKFKNICALKVAGCFLLLAIILNFISQYFGKEANEKDVMMCEEEIEADKPPTYLQQKKIDKHNVDAELYSNITNYLNLSSMTVMFVGLIILLIYFLATF